MERYIHHTLPIQVHLQICEALDKVVASSTHLRPQLIAFEQAKNKEIFEYSQVDGNRMDSLKCINVRLLTFLRYMHEAEQGCFPFTYGVDVGHDVPFEAWEQVPPKTRLAYHSRYKTFAEDQQNIKEAFNLINKPGPRNEIILGHKFKQLDRYSLIMQLREML